MGLRPLVITDGAATEDPERARWSRPLRDRAAMAALIPQLRASADVAAVVATSESAVVPAARLRADLGVPGTSLAVAERCTDKVRMKDALQRDGILCAAMVRSRDGLERDALIHRLGLPMVVKSRASSGGRGTRIAHAAVDVPERLSPGRMAEAFVTGTEMSVELLIARGEVVFENTTEYFRPGWANIVPSAVPDGVRAAVVSVARRAAAALRLQRGIAHAEVFVRGDGDIVFGETAARPPGGHLMELIERVYGFDPWEAFLACELGEVPTVAAAPSGAAGVWLLHPGPGRVTSVEGVAEARALPGVVDLPMRVAPGDDVAPRVGVGQEIGHITVVGRDRDQVAERLVAAHSALRVRVATAPTEENR